MIRYKLLSVVLLACFVGCATVQQECSRNEVVEFSQTSASAYSDPFNEIEVDVVFSKAAQTWRVPAFWAGGQQWKVRFAPPETGTYDYHWECTDTNNPDLNGQAGTLDVNEYQGTNKLLQHGHLKVSENKRYFEHADGTPFFWLADTWWKCLCYRLPWAGFQTLADDRSAKGFTAIQIVAGLYPEEPAFDTRGENEGGWVWEPNYARINTDYFYYMDRRIQYLVDSELVPCIVGCWGYYIDTVQWNGLGVAKMKQHWRNLVARYGAYPVVWIVAGEWNLPGDCGSIRMAQRNGWIELIEYVKTIDPYHSPATLHEGIHARTEPARSWVADQNLLDFDLLQTGHPSKTYYKMTVSNISACRSMIPAKPVVDGEVAYEGHCDRPEKNLLFNHDDDPPFPQRFLFWTSILQGAAGHTYGATGIWQVESPGYPHGWSRMCTNHYFWKTPWSTAMNFLGSTTLSIGKELITRYEWWRFEPRQDWVEPAGTSLTEPHSTWYNPLNYWNQIGGQHMLPYAAGIPGEVRLIYIPYGVSAPQVKNLEADVAYRAFYFKPLDGTEYDLGTVEPTAGTWQAPSVPSTALDWVLVLEKAVESDAATGAIDNLVVRKVTEK